MYALSTVQVRLNRVGIIPRMHVLGTVYHVLSPPPPLLLAASYKHAQGVHEVVTDPRRCLAHVSPKPTQNFALTASQVPAYRDTSTWCTENRLHELGQVWKCGLQLFDLCWNSTNRCALATQSAMPITRLCHALVCATLNVASGAHLSVGTVVPFTPSV